MDGVKIQILDETDKSWDGTKLPHIDFSNPTITMAKIIIDAGTEIPSHKHPVINAGYLICGQLTIYKKDGTVKELVAGDSCIELFEQFHSGKNNGNTKTEIIAFYIGESDTPITIEE